MTGSSVLGRILREGGASASASQQPFNDFRTRIMQDCKAINNFRLGLCEVAQNTARKVGRASVPSTPTACLGAPAGHDVSLVADCCRAQGENAFVCVFVFVRFCVCVRVCCECCVRVCVLCVRVSVCVCWCVFMMHVVADRLGRRGDQQRRKEL